MTTPRSSIRSDARSRKVLGLLARDEGRRCSVAGSIVPELLTSPSAMLATHAVIGCSTGFMVEDRGDWPQLTHRAARTSPKAIELSALSEEELPGLLTYLSAAPRLPFHFISVHGPSKGRDVSDSVLVDQLLALPVWVSAIVLHPDVMTDIKPYRRLGRRLAIENMDSRKTGGQTAADLRTYFQALPDARLCFDIAHAKSVDASLQVGGEILEAFADRLSHVHVSSLDEGQHHVPLSPADESCFAPLLRRCVDVPWILEAPLR